MLTNNNLHIVRIFYIPYIPLLSPLNNDLMIWYLFAAVTAIMLLQQATSSSALAVVLRVIPVTCPSTLHTTVHMCTARRRRSINENWRTAYGVEAMA